MLSNRDYVYDKKPEADGHVGNEIVVPAAAAAAAAPVPEREAFGRRLEAVLRRKSVMGPRHPRAKTLTSFILSPTGIPTKTTGPIIETDGDSVASGGSIEVKPAVVTMPQSTGVAKEGTAMERLNSSFRLVGMARDREDM